MKGKMTQGISKKILLIMFILSTLGAFYIPAAHAEGIIVDGVVDESDWTLWFTDDSQSPYFDVYWYLDSDNLYIAVLTDDTNDNDDLFRFAFKTHKGVDWWIEIKPGYWTKYRPSGGDWEGYWSFSRPGLPPGVSAASGKTDGKRSYELCIELSVLGMTESDLPDKLKAWFMVSDGNPEGPVNYYPNMLAGWFFANVHEPEEGENHGGGENPGFVVPELPVGTIMALISGLAALTLFALKRPIIRK